MVLTIDVSCIPFPANRTFNLQLLTTEIVTEVILEEFPHAHINQKNLRVGVSVVCYVCSLIYLTPVCKSVPQLPLVNLKHAGGTLARFEMLPGIRTMRL